MLRIQTEKNYAKYDEFCIVKRHADKINGMIFDARTANLFSISKDQYLQVSDIS